MSASEIPMLFTPRALELPGGRRESGPCGGESEKGEAGGTQRPWTAVQLQGHFQNE